MDVEDCAAGGKDDRRRHESDGSRPVRRFGDSPPQQPDSSQRRFVAMRARRSGWPVDVRPVLNTNDEERVVVIEDVEGSATVAAPGDTVALPWRIVDESGAGVDHVDLRLAVVDASGSSRAKSDGHGLTRLYRRHIQECAHFGLVV